MDRTMMIPKGPNSRHSASEYAFFPVPISEETNKAGTIHNTNSSMAKTKNVSILETLKNRLYLLEVYRLAGSVLTIEGRRGRILPSKSCKHKVISKINKVNRSACSWVVWNLREEFRAALYRLRSSTSEQALFFYALCVNERCLIMSTTQNPPCVCDVTSSSPVDQLFQRSTTFQAPDVVEAPPFGNRSSYDVLTVGRNPKPFPVYLVSIANKWQAESWQSAPPHAMSFKTAKTSSLVCALLNRERMESSKDGYVRHWHIRIKVNSRHYVISICLDSPFKPQSECDFPPAFIHIDGPYDDRRRIIGELNRAMDTERAPQEKRKRAYIAEPINPGEWQPCQPKGTPSNPPAEKPIKRYQFTGELVSISDPVEQRAQAINRLQGEIR